MSDSDSRRAPPAAPRVAVFGEVLFDEFPDRRVLGGAPFNVARHLRGLGLDPLFVSRVGEDAAGDDVLGAMHAAGLDARGMQRDPQRPTGRVRVDVGPGGHRFEILADQAYDHIDAEAAASAVAEARPGIVYFGTLAQRSAASRAALDAVLDAAPGATRVVDLNLRAPWYDRETLERSLAAADVLKLNAEELDEVARTLGAEGGDERDRARRLLERFSLRSLVVTRGEEGAWRFDAGTRGERGAAPREALVPGGAPVDVVDTVGAGDGFAAAIILGDALGWPVAETLARADALARAVCGIRGAVPSGERFYAPLAAAWGLAP